jgi:aryl-alcohol dehydrogenase-like predicted oxidoreductase
MLDDDVKKELVIVSRSYDYTREGMESSFNKALNDMGINRMSIFMLHEMESESMLRGHAPAMEYLLERKKSGVLDMTGISTHYISGVKAAARLPEIDCIFAILNREGLGIMDGSPAEMANALQEAHEAGKFIMIMKAVGGGHLFRNAGESLAWARDLPFADCVVVGMQSVEEIEYNCAVFENKAPSEKGCRVEEGAGGRSLLIEDYCQGCGACRDACPFHAITIVDGMAKHDKNACMLCSYCARHCPLFCIKVV